MKTNLTGSVCAAVAALLTAWPSVALAAQNSCFKDIAAYMVTTFGQRYKRDANLVTTQRRYGTQMFVEVADETGGTNVAISLLQKDARRGLCVVLTTFPVASLNVSKTDHAGKPLEFTGRDQASGDQPANEIAYRRGPSGRFLALHCRTIKYSDTGAAQPTTASCKDMLTVLGGNQVD